MSQIKMDSEDIAEIKNALQIIQGYIELVPIKNMVTDITNQIKRIDKLLPKVAFEGANREELK